MQNYVQPGKTLDVTLPYDVTPGVGVQKGDVLFGVACGSGGSGSTGQIDTEGVFILAKTSGETRAIGARVYWSSANKKTTTATGGNLMIGVCLATKGTSDLTDLIKLQGGGAVTLA